MRLQGGPSFQEKEVRHLEGKERQERGLAECARGDRQKVDGETMRGIGPGGLRIVLWEKLGAWKTVYWNGSRRKQTRGWESDGKNSQSEGEQSRRCLRKHSASCERVHTDALL